jgi:hypothetical protein
MEKKAVIAVEKAEARLKAEKAEKVSKSMEGKSMSSRTHLSNLQLPSSHRAVTAIAIATATVIAIVTATATVTAIAIVAAVIAANVMASNHAFHWLKLTGITWNVASKGISWIHVYQCVTMINQRKIFNTLSYTAYATCRKLETYCTQLPIIKTIQNAVSRWVYSKAKGKSVNPSVILPVKIGQPKRKLNISDVWVSLMS